MLEALTDRSDLGVHSGLISDGVMALAEASSNRVFLVDPGTLAPVAVYEVPGVPVDLVFADGGTTLSSFTDDDRVRFELTRYF